MHEATGKECFKCQPANNTSEDHDLVVSAHWGVFTCQLDAPAVPSDDVTKEPWLAKAPEPKAPLLPVPVLSSRPEGPPGGAALAEGGRISFTLGEPKISSSWDPEVFKKNTGSPAIAGFNFSDDNFRIEPAQVPGHGFVKPDCGKWVRKLKSENEIKDQYHSCNTLSCPRCWSDTITGKARDASERFEHYEKAKLEENTDLIPGEYKRASPRQIVFSISPARMAELWSKGGKNHGGFLELARGELNAIFHITKFVGGHVVYHANRVRHPDTGLTGSKAKELIRKEAMLAGAMKDDSPSWMLYAYIQSRKNWRDYFYFSPHFHCIGYGTMPDFEEFGEAFPGWMYKPVGTVPDSGIGGVLRYLYSHMAMIEDHHACTWHGRLSPVSLGLKELRPVSYEPVICEETGLPWVIIESNQEKEIGRVYTEMVYHYRSFFRKHRARGPPDPFKVRTSRHRRSSCPDWIRDRGILAMAAYCDEYGRL